MIPASDNIDADDQATALEFAVAYVKASAGTFAMTPLRGCPPPSEWKLISVDRACVTNVDCLTKNLNLTGQVDINWQVFPDRPEPSVVVRCVKDSAGLWQALQLIVSHYGLPQL
jgi:hypothetical protein